MPISLKQRLKIPVYDDASEVRPAKLNFDKSLCIQCGLCVTACAGGCIEIDNYSRSDYLSGNIKGKKGFPYLVATKNGSLLCAGCLTCAAACPKGAISIEQSFRAGYRLTKLHQASEMTAPRNY